jgi:adenine-specific DNA-methyltransferase
LDYFAGSGTTGHALLNLNFEDGGKRQFILCTNNENNICTDICYPRIANVLRGYTNRKGESVKGLGGNLKYYTTTFVPASPTDRNKELLTLQSTEILTLKEGTFEKVTENPSYVIYRNSDKYTGIIFDQLSFTEFKKSVAKINKPISLYIFSLADDDFSDDFADMRGLIKICAIPESILRVYRRIFR